MYSSTHPPPHASSIERPCARRRSPAALSSGALVVVVVDACGRTAAVACRRACGGMRGACVHACIPKTVLPSSACTHSADAGVGVVGVCPRARTRTRSSCERSRPDVVPFTRRCLLRTVEWSGVRRGRHDDAMGGTPAPAWTTWTTRGRARATGSRRLTVERRGRRAACPPCHRLPWTALEHKPAPAPPGRSLVPDTRERTHGEAPP